MSDAPFRVVIPARYASSRLPAKPLADLGGAPMIVRVLERAQRSGAREVIVATDDERVRDAVLAAGGDARMTGAEHASGTDRIAQVATEAGWPDDAIVVNLQGDEPLLPAELPGQLADALASHPSAGIATMVVPIEGPEELFTPSAVKAMLDDEGFALTFSRAPIPWARDAFADGQPATLPPGVPFLRHLGLYAYRVGTLTAMAAAPASAIERAESLEQLRALSRGVRIHCTVLDHAPPPGIDTPEDLARVRQGLASGAIAFG
ncbi:MAG: 3-deoxy-manno-octulosonate cytidylyltransferase [Deltaproteobacteria bacterium]|nr:3-deoxy-manno-octulosonate cytidylyltransferase [Deltaproteobacteria bacterium]